MAIQLNNLSGANVSRTGKDLAGAGAVRAVRRALLPDLPRRASVGYTRFVNVMKALLPALAIVLIVLVVLWPQVMNEDKSFRLGIADLEGEKTTEPTMENVRFLGTDQRQQPYTITADLAHNVDPDGAQVFLDAPKADILLDDGTWLIVSANEGIFLRKQKTLELTGAVNLFHDSGYEFRTERAQINLNAGQAEGHDPVRGQGPFGDLTAEGFRIINQGKTLMFIGRSRAVLFPPRDGVR